MSFPDERLKEAEYAGPQTRRAAPAFNLPLWLGGAALAFGIFVLITRELIEGETGAIDRQILTQVVSERNQLLTRIAIDVTSLGSTTLVVLFSAFAMALLLMFRDKLGALQLLASSMGAGLLTFSVKNIIERARPDLALQLVRVSGYSYPSGHSVLTAAFYLTIAIIASHHVRYRPARVTIILAAALVLAMVGASRIYLGVHYASDVVSGLSLGAAWSLLLSGLVARYEGRGL